MAESLSEAARKALTATDWRKVARTLLRAIRNDPEGLRRAIAAA